MHKNKIVFSLLYDNLPENYQIVITNVISDIHRNLYGTSEIETKLIYSYKKRVYKVSDYEKNMRNLFSRIEDDKVDYFIIVFYKQQLGEVASISFVVNNSRQVDLDDEQENEVKMLSVSCIGEEFDLKKQQYYLVDLFKEMSTLLNCFSGFIEYGLYDAYRFLSPTFAEYVSMDGITIKQSVLKKRLRGIFWGTLVEERLLEQNNLNILDEKEYFHEVSKITTNSNNKLVYIQMSEDILECSDDIRTDFKHSLFEILPELNTENLSLYDPSGKMYSVYGKEIML